MTNVYMRCIGYYSSNSVSLAEISIVSRILCNICGKSYDRLCSIQPRRTYSLVYNAIRRGDTCVVPLDDKEIYMPRSTRPSKHKLCKTRPFILPFTKEK